MSDIGGGSQFLSLLLLMNRKRGGGIPMGNMIKEIIKNKSYELCIHKYIQGAVLRLFYGIGCFR